MINLESWRESLKMDSSRRLLQCSLCCYYSNKLVASRTASHAASRAASHVASHAASRAPIKVNLCADLRLT